VHCVWHRYVIQNTNQPTLLERMLTADVRVGLARDWRGRSALHVAIEHGKWRALQLIIDALLRGKFSLIPGSMQIISECLASMAYKYPLDFLHLISSFQLQPEPEVLGDVDASDVMLRSRLLKGSHRRCPKGLWNHEIEEHRVVVGAVEQAMDAVSMTSKCGPPSERGQRRNSVSSGGLEKRNVQLSTGVHTGRLATPVRRSSSEGPAALLGAAGLAAGLAAEMSMKKGDDSSSIEIGFSSHSSQTGVQAFRVPLENFAALAGSAGAGGREGSLISPLQLVVEAVEATHVDYSVPDDDRTSTTPGPTSLAHHCCMHTLAHHPWSPIIHSDRSSARSS
jgi:hypothetical protein